MSARAIRAFLLFAFVATVFATVFTYHGLFGRLQKLNIPWDNLSMAFVGCGFALYLLCLFRPTLFGVPVAILVGFPLGLTLLDVVPLSERLYLLLGTALAMIVGFVYFGWLHGGENLPPRPRSGPF